MYIPPLVLRDLKREQHHNQYKHPVKVNMRSEDSMRMIVNFTWMTTILSGVNIETDQSP